MNCQKFNDDRVFGSLFWQFKHTRDRPFDNVSTKNKTDMDMSHYWQFVCVRSVRHVSKCTFFMSFQFKQPNGKNLDISSREWVNNGISVKHFCYDLPACRAKLRFIIAHWWPNSHFCQTNCLDSRWYEVVKYTQG